MKAIKMTQTKMEKIPRPMIPKIQLKKKMK